MKFLPVVFDLVSSHGGVVVGRQPGAKVSRETCAKREAARFEGSKRYGQWFANCPAVVPRLLGSLKFSRCSFRWRSAQRHFWPPFLREGCPLGPRAQTQCCQESNEESPNKQNDTYDTSTQTGQAGFATNLYILPKIIRQLQGLSCCIIEDGFSDQ